jgi:hypothetical protein
MTDFFPFSYPTYSSKIEFPQDISEYGTIESGDIKMREKEKTVELDLDTSTLKDRSVKELKNIARTLGVKGASGMNKQNLIKFIKLKLKR